MKALRNRKLNRLSGYDYSQSGLCFVTICVKSCSREQKYLFPTSTTTDTTFGNIENGVMILNEYGQHTYQCWVEIPNHFPDITLDEFVVMPDHVHGVLGIVGNNNYCSLPDEISWQTKWGRSLSSVIRGFKIGVTKYFWANNIQSFQWQKSYHERIIRNESELNRIRQYITNNPIMYGTKIFVPRSLMNPKMQNSKG